MERINILFLDDDENRTQFVRNLCMDFNEAFDGCLNLCEAKNFREFKEQCNSNKFDIICFDHDLAPEHYENYHEDDYSGAINTGYDCAKWFVDNMNYAPYVFVHSWSPIGAERIVNVLEMKGGFSGKRITFGKDFLEDLWETMKSMLTIESEEAAIVDGSIDEHCLDFVNG